jgi:hypothetical protein
MFARLSRQKSGYTLKMIGYRVLGVFVTAVAAASAAEVTFNKDVLPVLEMHCQECHRPGEAAPMSLLTYKDARPWAAAIKQAVVTRKMPPWHAADVAHEK